MQGTIRCVTMFCSYNRHCLFHKPSVWVGLQEICQHPHIPPHPGSESWLHPPLSSVVRLDHVADALLLTYELY